MKSYDDKPAWSGLLGLLIAAWGFWTLAGHKPGRLDVESALRLGYARPAAALETAGMILPAGDGGWLEAFNRALRVQKGLADKLRVEAPSDDDLLLLETDVLPDARYGMFQAGGAWSIHVSPWKFPPWAAPSASGGLVSAAAYPVNGRMAYYDVGRVWITDLDGRRMQSLQHVPLLENGGTLYWDYLGKRLCWIGAGGGAAAAELGIEGTP